MARRKTNYRCIFCKKHQTHTSEIMWKHIKRDHKFDCMIEETESMKL